MSDDAERREIGTPDLIALLTGGWTFDRRIQDRRRGTEGHATGVAEFMPEGEGLRWVETGELTLDGFTGPTSRELKVVADGDAWQVLFDDGRPFHRIDLSDGHCPVEHPCRDDRYRGELRALDTPGGPELETTWTVTGPQKDHRIFTSYRRRA